MASSRTARRYAAALFSLAKEDTCVTEVRQELDGLAALIDENEELYGVLMTPLHPLEERKAVLKALAVKLQMRNLVKNFLGLLVDRRRLINFASIHAEYGRLADEASGLVTAEITTAAEIDERRKDRLRRALSQRTGREVRLETRVDPNLIAGAIARVGDLVFDGSLRTQLAQLGATLTKGS